MSKKHTNHHITWVLVGILLIMVILLGIFLYQRFACLSINFLMCLTSKSYISKTADLSFRYPAFFPLDKPTEDWEIEQSKNTFKELDRLDFSKEFFFNAGGDRLGLIKVDKRYEIDNLKDYEKEISKPLTASSAKGEFIVPPPHIEHVKIGNNIEALKIIYGNDLAVFSSPEASYVFFKDGFKYTVDFYYNDYYHKLPKEEYLQGFNLILSTLKI